MIYNIFITYIYDDYMITNTFFYNILYW